jgi:hypothetical protein
MKYPKEYAKLAADVIGAAYFPDEDSDVEPVKLLTLAAIALHMIAMHMDETTGDGIDACFYNLISHLTPPEPYENGNATTEGEHGA